MVRLSKERGEAMVEALFIAILNSNRSCMAKNLLIVPIGKSARASVIHAAFKI
jgi:hypothetical protein